MRFTNRTEAGKKLAEALQKYRGEEVVVYALPRGGVVLGVEVAKALGAPLDLVIPRKVGHPLAPEYAICAVSEHGNPICNEAETNTVNPKWLEQAIEAERQEARRRRKVYLADRDPVPVEGKIAISVDDGIATGLTMRAAIRDIKTRHPREIVVAVPVLPQDTAEELEAEGNRVVALERARPFLGAIGAYYNNFPQVTDQQVISFLGLSHSQTTSGV